MAKIEPIQAPCSNPASKLSGEDKGGEGAYGEEVYLCSHSRLPTSINPSPLLSLLDHRAAMLAFATSQDPQSVSSKLKHNFKLPSAHRLAELAGALDS